MGVYSLEAAELLAAKNKPAVNESFTPYENPILEYGIRSIRADFALFEAQLELDFKEYYDTLALNEKDGDDTKGQTVVNAQNGQADPTAHAQERDAEREQDKKEKAEDDAEKAQIDASKKSKLNQTVGKFRIDMGTLQKFADVIKKIWANLVTSLKLMMDRFLKGFYDFKDKTGESFAKNQEKIKQPGYVHKCRKGAVHIIDPESIKTAFKEPIENCKALMSKTSIDEVESGIRSIDDDINKALSENTKSVGVDDAAKIITGFDLMNNTYISDARTEYDDLTRLAKEQADKANREYNESIRTNGQEATDKNSDLQLKKEMAQKVSQCAGRIGAKYLHAMSAAAGSIQKAAASIVADVEGQKLGDKVANKAGEVKNAVQNRGKEAPEMSADEARAKFGTPGDDQGNKYPNVNVNHASYSFEDDDLFTVNETADILRVMVEDTCDINFDECFDF